MKHSFYLKGKPEWQNFRHRLLAQFQRFPPSSCSSQDLGTNNKAGNQSHGSLGWPSGVANSGKPN